MKFENQVALITGASTGIGRETAVLLAKEGAKIWIADLNEKGGKETASMIKNAEFVKADVSKDDEVKDLIDQIIREDRSLDLAFNNAGIEGSLKPLHEYSLEEYQKIIDINLKGVFLCMKYEIEKMLESKKGSIVNTSSIYGQVGLEAAPIYTASKFAVAGLTKSAALAYAKKNIRVNAVAPGLTQTSMLERLFDENPALKEKFIEKEPIGRLADPKEIAKAVAYLLSEEASYVTGHVLAADGGYLAQ
jgi:NAD(P)-dependent dehydrogenase (short-subunit alcohol dehydrogenase family)